MMAVKNKLEINLPDLVKKLESDLRRPDLLSVDDKKRLGNVIIDRIRERTQSGVGVSETGREYQLQSKAYTKQYARKKGDSRVNLTLSGDMLEKMYVKDIGKNKIAIAVNDDDYGKLRGAEEGIQTVRRDAGGSILHTKQGRTLPGPIVKRPFLHLSSTDIKEITTDPDFIDTVKRAINRELSKRGKK